jgi:hypothetical protein
MMNEMIQDDSLWAHSSAAEEVAGRRPTTRVDFSEKIGFLLAKIRRVFCSNDRDGARETQMFGNCIDGVIHLRSASFVGDFAGKGPPKSNS